MSNASLIADSGARHYATATGTRPRPGMRGDIGHLCIAVDRRKSAGGIFQGLPLKRPFRRSEWKRSSTLGKVNERNPTDPGMEWLQTPITTAIHRTGPGPGRDYGQGPTRLTCMPLYRNRMIGYTSRHVLFTRSWLTYVPTCLTLRCLPQRGMHHGQKNLQYVSHQRSAECRRGDFPGPNISGQYFARLIGLGPYPTCANVTGVQPNGLSV